MTTRVLQITILTLWIIALPLILLSQQSQPPKIGLTLSGGGAKGLAHIGILKAIDSAGLRIDMITGTSMGSIVGGMYAAGYSGTDIERLARDIDWDKLLSNTISMKSYIMEEKSEYGKYAAELPFNKNKVSLPAGFLESQELWLKLEEIFFPVQNITNFDQLSIPFRCIGTDLKTGKAYVFDKGNIVQAIRASMAIPGVFSPVDVDGGRYVDGGVVRNFPVKDAIAMGAQYTIGVSVSTPLKNVEELDNAVKVLTQVVFLNEGKDRDEESKLCNFLINVPMGDFTSASFNDGDSIIDLGIAQGIKYFPYFKNLADSLEAIYPGFSTKDQKRLPTVKAFKINDVKVSGLINKNQEKAFLEQISGDSSRYYDFARLQKNTRNAFAFRMYKSITYAINPDSTGSLELDYNIKPEASTSLKAGFHYNSFSGFSILANITTRNWFTPFSRSLVSLSVGENFRGLLEHTQMFGYRSPLSNRLRFYAEHQEIPEVDDFKNMGLYRISYYTIDNLLLRSSKRKWSGGAGMKWEYVDAKPKILAGQNLAGNNSWFNLYGTMLFNSLEKPFFPARGWKADLEAGYIFGMAPNFRLYDGETLLGGIDKSDNNLYGNYFRITLNSENIIPVSRKWAFQLKGQAGVNFGPKNSFLNGFNAGGLNHTYRNQITFAGLKEAEITSESMATLGAGMRWNTFGSFFTTFSANSMMYDFLPKDGSTLTTKWSHGAAVTLGYNLILGPIEWSIMYSGDLKDVRTYLNFGVPFK